MGGGRREGDRREGRWKRVPSGRSGARWGDGIGVREIGTGNYNVS